MGTKAIEIVEKSGIDVKELIKLLNKAYCDEWLAHYQYWIGAKLAVGIPRHNLEEEMIEHAGEELKHADMLAERIIQLGGTPEIDPSKWNELANCKYDAPTNPDVDTLLQQNIKAEQCAIQVYKNLLDWVMKNGRDTTTFHMLRKILDDEIEHEHDLQDIQEDVETFVKKHGK